MPVSLDGKLVIAVSSRALFDFEEANQIYESGEVEAYRAFQKDNLEMTVGKGAAFPLVEKLLRFNSDGQHRVEVAVLSRNDPVSGLRVFKAVEHYGLTVERGVFTQGREPYNYLKPLQADLFLSANESDVREALDQGFPAARVYPKSLSTATKYPDEIRIAFDGDAVLFSDEAERVYQEKGLVEFTDHEKDKADLALEPGPFKPFLEALKRLQDKAKELPMGIRTALVTARSAPAHERAIRTLMSWNIEVDEAMFLGGLRKREFLEAFAPDFFFDDHTGHCDPAASVAATGHVVSGVNNE